MSKLSKAVKPKTQTLERPAATPQERMIEEDWRQQAEEQKAAQAAKTRLEYKRRGAR